MEEIEHNDLLEIRDGLSKWKKYATVNERIDLLKKGEKYTKNRIPYINHNGSPINVASSTLHELNKSGKKTVLEYLEIIKGELNPENLEEAPFSKKLEGIIIKYSSE